MKHLENFMQSSIEIWATKNEANDVVKMLKWQDIKILSYQSEVKAYFEYLFKYKWINLHELETIADHMPSDYIKKFPINTFNSEKDYHTWQLFFQDKDHMIECTITTSSGQNVIYIIDYKNHELQISEMSNYHWYDIHRNKMMVRVKSILEL